MNQLAPTLVRKHFAVAFLYHIVIYTSNRDNFSVYFLLRSQLAKTKIYFTTWKWLDLEKDFYPIVCLNELNHIAALNILSLFHPQNRNPSGPTCSKHGSYYPAD